MQTTASVAVRVWGDYACFSRPEFKVERVSYPVMTPSAARGVLEAILWKPEFRYEIRRIGIITLGTQTTVLRNELAERQGERPVTVERVRQQRSSLLLKGVEYLIEADMVLRPHATDPVFKYSDQFRRRIERGQYHHTPYLGTREFAADFAPVNGETPDASLNLDLGIMLFDIAFVPSKKRVELEFHTHDAQGARRAQGYANPIFFQARIEEGWLDVPSGLYAETHRQEGDDA